jgi:hypothetical protein
VEAITFKILFILIAGIGLVYLYSHPLPAQTAIPDSMVDSTKTEVQLDSAQTEMQLKATAIFKVECAIAGCHRGARPKKDLDLEPDKFLTSTINVISQEKKDFKRIDTANPEKSYLLMKIKGEKGIKGSRMPDEAPPLKKEQIKAIEDWILSLKEVTLDKEKTTAPADTTKLQKALNDSSQAK